MSEKEMIKTVVLTGLLVALFQSTNSASPIPDFAIQSNDDDILIRNDPAYRLPTTVRPSHYYVTITPYFNTEDVNAFTFDGEVRIVVRAQVAGVTSIVLHAEDLTINTLTDIVISDQNGLVIPTNSISLNPALYFLTIELQVPLVLNVDYNIDIVYRGIIQIGMRGFYRSWYYDGDQLKWMATTQFQPGHARKAFPCFDEPSFKAVFTFTINRPADFSPSLSCMPIANTTTLLNERVSETFYPTPLMSTYLTAFIVSQFEATDSTPENSTRPFAVYARSSASENGLYAFDVGQKILEAMEEHTQIPYYTMAENIKLDQAAIPDFAAGAMENWGLMTYRESILLYDDVHTGSSFKHRIAAVISHEVSHMWFGNLVTCDWWDDLWLNEGFARYYQFFLTQTVEPEMGYDVRFIVEQVQTSLFSDSLDTAHALSNPSINSPTAVSAHFSTITYNKGASIIRMTEHLLGYDTFLAALRSYLQEKAYSTALPEDLFSAFQTAADASGALSAYPGITISSYYRTWTEQGGNPLVTVSVNQETGDITVSQARFNRDNGVSTISSLWQIPLTYTRQGDIDFENTKPSQFLTTESVVINKGSTDREWVIFNKQQTGFYRVNYDDDTWDLIVDYLRSDERENIHQLNRAQIVDEAFQLARAEVITYQKALHILSILEYEVEYGPWYAAITGFNFLRRRLAHETESLAKLNQYILELSAHVSSTLTFDHPEDDTHMDSLTRMYLGQFVCAIGNQDCIDSAVRHFAALRDDQIEVPANLRSWVYCNALRHGTAADYQFLWNRFLGHNVYNEQVTILENIGCTADEESIRHFLSQIIAENSLIRVHDQATAFNIAVTGNEDNSQVVLQWLSENLERVNEVFEGLATPVAAIAARLITEEQISNFESWLNTNQASLGSAYATGVAAAATASQNLVWTDNRIEDLNSFLDSRPSSAVTPTIGFCAMMMSFILNAIINH